VALCFLLGTERLWKTTCRCCSTCFDTMHDFWIKRFYWYGLMLTSKPCLFYIGYNVILDKENIQIQTWISCQPFLNPSNIIILSKSPLIGILCTGYNTVRLIFIVLTLLVRWFLLRIDSINQTGKPLLIVTWWLKT
jgi:hypothetical protein